MRQILSLSLSLSLLSKYGLVCGDHKRACPRMLSGFTNNGLFTPKNDTKRFNDNQGFLLLFNRIIIPNVYCYKTLQLAFLPKEGLQSGLIKKIDLASFYYNLLPTKNMSSDLIFVKRSDKVNASSIFFFTEERERELWESKRLPYAFESSVVS